MESKSHTLDTGMERLWIFSLMYLAQDSGINFLPEHMG